MNFKSVGSLILICTALSACSVNPVTGDNDLNFMSESWERETGKALYYQSRQAQGGDFILDEQLNHYVKSVNQRLAKQASRNLNWEIEILNSSVPNAWALPGGKMAINRGLLTELNSEAELAAVLGHEIVHADAAHGAQAQSKGVLGQAGALAAGIYLGSKADSGLSKQAAILLPSLGVHLLTQKYGRDAERESDKYGIIYMSKAGYDPQGAVELQETFLRMSDSQKSNWMNGLFASHPPSAERLENNRRMAAKLPQGGEMGRDRYQRQISRLKKMQPAYTTYDDGRKALKEKNYSQAMKLADRSIRQLPNEAIFYSLRGDIHIQRKRYGDAEHAFSQAIQRNDGYFYPFLRRGLLRNHLGKAESARRDLQRSQQLAPSADASKILGDLEMNRGNRELAVRYYQMAARSNAPSGHAARAQLQRLGIQ